MPVSKCIRKEEQLQVVLEALVQTANQICQFSQRDTEFHTVGFVQTLVLGWLRQTDASLNELAQSAQDLGISVTGSAIHERFGTAAVELWGRVLVGALRQVGPYPRLPMAALESFTAIHVTDSTQIGLPKALLLEFQGANQNAMLNLHVTIDYLTGQWVALEMQDAKAPDQNSDLPLRHSHSRQSKHIRFGLFQSRTPP
jgi:hypothetical protein